MGRGFEGGGDRVGSGGDTEIKMLIVICRRDHCAYYLSFLLPCFHF